MTGWFVRTDQEGARSKVGGLPDGPAGFKWPSCTQCSGPMQFLAQLALPDCGVPDLVGRDQLLLIFQCQNDPGMCDEWDAASGANRALLVPADGAVAVRAPSKGATLLPSVDPARVVAVPPEARALGVVGGDPEWIQGDETPHCPGCGSPMRFVLQLEPHGGGGINFGDSGLGYAFLCDVCPQEARFLWQCG